jgi:hypothetical protein
MKFEDVEPGMVLISRDPVGAYHKEDLLLIRSKQADSFSFNQLRSSTQKTRWVFYRTRSVVSQKDWGQRGSIFEDAELITSKEMRIFIKMVMTIPEADRFFD